MIWVAFALEAIVMIAVVAEPDRLAQVAPAAVRARDPRAAVRARPWLQSARALRLLRLVFAGAILHRLVSPEGLRRAALFTVLLIVGAAIAFQAVENGHHPEPVSLWDGLWWAVETVTTVGYGDIYPVTDAGRVIAMIVMLSGIGFVALLTGSIAQRFLSGSLEAEQREDELMGPPPRHLGAA